MSKNGRTFIFHIVFSPIYYIIASFALGMLYYNWIAFGGIDLGEFWLTGWLIDFTCKIVIEPIAEFIGITAPFFKALLSLGGIFALGYGVRFLDHKFDTNAFD